MRSPNSGNRRESARGDPVKRETEDYPCKIGNQS